MRIVDGNCITREPKKHARQSRINPCRVHACPDEAWFEKKFSSSVGIQLFNIFIRFVMNTTNVRRRCFNYTNVWVLGTTTIPLTRNVCPISELNTYVSSIFFSFSSPLPPANTISTTRHHYHLTASMIALASTTPSKYRLDLFCGVSSITEVAPVSPSLHLYISYPSVP